MVSALSTETEEKVQDSRTAFSEIINESEAADITLGHSPATGGLWTGSSPLTLVIDLQFSLVISMEVWKILYMCAVATRM